MAEELFTDRKKEFDQLNTRLGWTSENVINLNKHNYKALADLPRIVFGEAAMQDESSLEKLVKEKTAVSLRERFQAHAGLVRLYNIAYQLAEIAGSELLASPTVPQDDLLSDEAIGIARQLRIMRDNAEHRGKEHQQMAKSYGGVMLMHKMMTDADMALEIKKATQKDPGFDNLTSLSAIHAQMLINHDELLKGQYTLITTQINAANLSMAHTVARQLNLDLGETGPELEKRITIAAKLVESATRQYLSALDDTDRFSNPVIPAKYRPHS